MARPQRVWRANRAPPDTQHHDLTVSGHRTFAPAIQNVAGPSTKATASQPENASEVDVKKKPQKEARRTSKVMKTLGNALRALAHIRKAHKDGQLPQTQNVKGGNLEKVKRASQVMKNPPMELLKVLNISSTKVGDSWSICILAPSLRSLVAAGLRPHVFESLRKFADAGCISQRAGEPAGLELLGGFRAPSRSAAADEQDQGCRPKYLRLSGNPITGEKEYRTHVINLTECWGLDDFLSTDAEILGLSSYANDRSSRFRACSPRFRIPPVYLERFASCEVNHQRPPSSSAADFEQHKEAANGKGCGCIGASRVSKPTPEGTESIRLRPRFQLRSRSKTRLARWLHDRRCERELLALLKAATPASYETADASERHDAESSGTPKALGVFPMTASLAKDFATGWRAFTATSFVRLVAARRLQAWWTAIAGHILRHRRWGGGRAVLPDIFWSTELTEYGVQ
eukprot:scaffold48_cov311-Pinguiococcus_pyrenoidosus.AAC.65